MNVLSRTRPDTRDIALAWLKSFGDALQAGDAAAAAGCFAADGHWRDVIAFTWQIQTASGPAAIAAALAPTLARTKPSGFHIPADRSQPRRERRAGTDCIEAVFEFETAFGRANGVVRLVEEGGAWRAWTVVTTLEELHGYPDGRPRAVSDAEKYSRDFGGENWLDQRRKAQTYTDRDPTVLIVGGGQAGLSAAARLSHLGVDTLIIDRNERIGDNWRLRYHSLTLHNEVHVNHLPLMPFPPTWPVFIPKDKLANWFETYVEASSSTSGPAPSWPAAAATTRKALDGDAEAQRRQRAHHEAAPRLLATGVSGIPIWPKLPGPRRLQGRGDALRRIHHRRRLEGPQGAGHRHRQQRPRRGAGSLRQRRRRHHRAAQPDLHREHPRGAEGLFDLQRRPAVRGLRPARRLDALSGAAPSLPAFDRRDAQGRQALLKGLEARGFQLTFGEDDTGFQMMYLRRGGGYYFNVGCSDMIVDGRIGLLQYDTIDRFVAGGVVLKDGTTRPLDLVVVATGYESQQEFVRATLGNDVAERIGPVWGFDEGGELRNMWGPTAQDGLWFTAGSLRNAASTRATSRCRSRRGKTD